MLNHMLETTSRENEITKKSLDHQGKTKMQVMDQENSVINLQQEGGALRCTPMERWCDFEERNWWHKERVGNNR